MVKRITRQPKAYLGIDPASNHLAFVAMTSLDDYFSEFFVLAKSSGPEACAAALTVTRAVVDRMRVRWPGHMIMATIEQPVVGRGGVWATLAQAFTSGAVQGELHGAGCRVITANNSHWKKVVIGKGNATKDEIAEGVRLRWPALHEEASGSQDVIDAGALALLAYGCRN